MQQRVWADNAGRRKNRRKRMLIAYVLRGVVTILLSLIIVKALTLSSVFTST